MTSTRKPRVPSYRLHKPSGRAVVTLQGKDYYLGDHGTPESHAEYNRLIAEYFAQGGQTATLSPSLVRPKAPFRGLTVSEMVLAYWNEAETYYSRDGEPTSELDSMRLALRYLRPLYGNTLAADFGPLALKTVRQSMIEAELSRGVINGYAKRIVRVFKWAVENELIPASVFHGLQAVRGLRKGRSEARETEPVSPAPIEHVEAVLELVSVQVAAMIRLQLFTGMRPGEVIQMKPRDINREVEPWVYIPERHKTEHHGHKRRIPLGPEARTILEPFLDRAEDAHLFSPVEAEEARKARLRLARKSKLTPSQIARAERRKARSHKRKRRPREFYVNESYRRAIARACEKAEIASWHPHQLRHNAATFLRKKFGLEAACAVLGHKSVAATEIYAERDLAKAMEIMEKVG